jgi:replication initiation and membrane attachment protein
MKLDNVLEFTENHRFYVYRDFALSALEEKILNRFYQPMVGAAACGLYKLLMQQLPAESVGFSGLEQQRKLFLALGAEPGEKGRRLVADCASRLEAVGLLDTYRRTHPDLEEAVYFYHLQPPLNPYEFFRNQHLTLLLRDRIGKHAVLQLHEEFCATESAEWSGEHIVSERLTVPFYDLFELNARVIDYELEQALAEAAPALSREAKPAVEHMNFRYEEILLKFPKLSANRRWVEQLDRRPEQLAAINYVARKYRLTLQELCRLLDEEDVFDAQGELNLDELQHLANLVFRQHKRRQQERERLLQSQKPPKAEREEKAVAPEYWLDVPEPLKDQCDQAQYNMMLRNQSYIEVLEMFFPGNVPDPLLDLFGRIDLIYKLEEEVINVLIHYLKVCNLPWTRPFVESVAADMLGRQIRSYEQAVEYIREHMDMKNRKGGKAAGVGAAAPAKAASPRGNAGKAPARPKLPVYKSSGAPRVTDEQYEEILRKVREMERRST